MTVTKAGSWALFWRSVVRFQADKVNPWIAVRNTLGLAVPLAVATALGQVPAGLAMSTGALNVSFRDSASPYIQRARMMLAASLIAGSGVFAGGISGRNNLIALLVAGVWAFGAGMLVALSTAAADLGVLSLVLVLVYSSSQQAGEHPVYAGMLAFAGGLIQTLLAVLFWPLRRYVPERRALSDLYMALAQAAEVPIQATQAPPASPESTAAQTALAALDRDDSLEGIRYRSLLTQAERMRVSLLALSRIRNRMEREIPGSHEAGILNRYFDACSRVLRAIGTTIVADKLEDVDLHELEALAAKVDEKSEARFQMSALAGQLRAAADLAAHTTPAGAETFEKGEEAKPWRLRFGGKLATLRANLSLDSAAFRHALRLAVCVMIGDALARGFELRRAYWLPMTIAIVLKPDFTATVSRGVLRLMGTFVGLTLATGLFHALPPGDAWQVLAIAVTMFLLRFFGPGNYGIFSTFVTALVVLLIAMTGVSPKDVIVSRAWNTLAGGGIALLAYWLWPTWERTQFSEVMAQALDAYRNYFRAIREGYLRRDTASAQGLDRVRIAGRLARTNLEASVDRLRAEPGTSAESVSRFSSILATSLRLAHALMALEAGLHSGIPAPPQETFQPFADHVELTLYDLAAALRGSVPAPVSLPDLREDHRRLLESSVATFVGVETDRITNSLNTLAETLLGASLSTPAPAP